MMYVMYVMKMILSKSKLGGEAALLFIDNSLLDDLLAVLELIFFSENIAREGQITGHHLIMNYLKIAISHIFLN